MGGHERTTIQYFWKPNAQLEPRLSLNTGPVLLTGRFLGGHFTVESVELLFVLKTNYQVFTAGPNAKAVFRRGHYLSIYLTT
jgi:hypothetical protein